MTCIIFEDFLLKLINIHIIDNQDTNLIKIKNY